MIKKIKFLNKTKATELDVNWRLGLWEVADSRDLGRETVLHVSVGGLIRFLCMAAVIGYLMVAGVVYTALRQNKYNFVSYLDMVLYPVRKDEIRAKRGRAQIAEGMDELKAGKFSDGFANLNAGLNRDPSDNLARLTQAQIFLQLNAVDRATKSLLEGFDYGYPGKQYMQFVFSLATNINDLKFMDEVTTKGLAVAPAGLDAKERQWLFENRIQALMGQEKYDEAISKINGYKGELSSNLKELRVLAYISAKQYDEAIGELLQWRAQAEKDKENFPMRLLVRAYRESGKIHEMQLVLLDMARANPTSSTPYIFSIVQNYMAGEKDTSRKELQAFLARYEGQEGFFKAVALPLSEIGAPEMVDLIFNTAKEKGALSRDLYITRADAYMNAGHYLEAQQQIKYIRENYSDLKPEELSVLNTAGRLLNAALDPSDGAQKQLIDSIRDQRLPLPFYKQILQVLTDSKRYDTAKEAIVFALGQYPNSPIILEKKQLVDDQLAAIAEAEAEQRARESKMLNPSLVTKEVFFTKLDELTTKKDYASASRLVSELQTAKPLWLKSAMEEVEFREISLHTKTGDTPALVSALRKYLDGTAEHVTALVPLAKQLHEDGNNSAAVTIMREIQRANPGAVFASKYLTEWQPGSSENSVSESPEILVKPVLDIAPVPDKPVPTTLAEFKTYDEFRGSLDSLKKENKWDEALNLIRMVKATDPAWYVKSKVEVGLDEIDMLSKKDEVLSLQLAIRQFLNGDLRRSAGLLDLAIALHENGDASHSEMMVKEIVRKSPDFNRAAQVLQKWTE